MISSTIGISIKPDTPEIFKFIQADLIVNHSHWTTSSGLDPRIQNLANLPWWTRRFAYMEYNWK